MVTGIFARLFGCLCVLSLGMVASHAEAAGPDDVTITDTTDYRYCMNGTEQASTLARPPYYVALVCVDRHSSNPLFHPRCNNVAPYSFCTVQDCEQARQRLGASPRPLGNGATLQHVCAEVNGGQWTLIAAPSADQESLAREPLAAETAGKAPSCDDVVISDGLLGKAAGECNIDWLDRPSRLDILAMARQCMHSITDRERLLQAGFDRFDASMKELGHKAACAKMDATMSEMDKIVMADPVRRAEAIETEKSFATTPKSAKTMTERDALKYCANNPDARESGRDNELPLSVRACANRILLSQRH